MKNFFLNVLLLSMSVLVAVGVGELYFRLFDPQSIIPRYVETSPYGIRKNIANVRGMMLVPEYRHGFSTNSQGFRGTTEYSVPKPTGVYRILVLGDSVTLGHGVEDEATFSSHIERQLSAHRRTEVINMGVSGFGTAEELIQLRNIGWQYDPDLVILTYFPNDPYNNVVSQLFSVTDGKLIQKKETFVPAIYIRDRLYAIPGYSFLCQNSHLVNFIRNRASGFFIGQLAQQNSISSQTSQVLSQPEEELTMLLMDEMMREVEQHRVPLLILNIPVVSKGNIISNFPGKRIREHASNVHIMDVNDTIYSRHGLSELSYEKDSHPRPFAHELIGKEVADFIQSKVWAFQKG